MTDEEFNKLKKDVEDAEKDIIQIKIAIGMVLVVISVLMIQAISG